MSTGPMQQKARQGSLLICGTQGSYPVTYLYATVTRVHHDECYHNSKAKESGAGLGAVSDKTLFFFFFFALP
jgi:hypothetical protein